ncbi:phage portal protein [Mangrovicella endophytica]|uniref:phage portal protein n=1 Tax=Mangrovicella endophytica TaxID=2066697 RepID=UPI0012FFF010|nr:phage portal protein [Mangrovicella endophytica]
MFELFGGGAVADYAVTGRQALEVPAVSSAISLISGSIASLGILVEKRDGTTWTAAPEHPVARLLEDAPNDWSDTYTLIRDLVVAALTCNEGGLAWVNRRDGEPVEIVHYAQGSFTADYSSDGRREPSYRIGNRPVGNGDVIHLRGPFDRCPLSLASGAIGVVHKLERHVGSFFSQAARPGGVITSPKQLGDEGVKRMLKGWKAAHEGAGKAGRTAILWDGATWAQMTMTAVDAQLLETWQHAILEIGRHFRVPPGALYDFSRQTWSNMESAQKEWLAGLEFWLRPLEGAMRRALFTAEEGADYRIRFDRDDFTAVDLTARATAISSLISSRVLNPNEGRDWLGMGPREGGAEFANPHTGASQAGAAAPQNPPQEPSNDA